MLSFQADYVFPVSFPIIKNGVVTVDESGKLIAVTSEKEPRPDSSLTKFNGIICPGFVNAHSQLELSHFKNKIEPGTGFVKSLLKRHAMQTSSQNEILFAASEADKEMFENGIVAAGDATSSTICRSIKSDSQIYYHSLIEANNFDPEKASATFNDALTLLQEYKNGSCSITPQAPYSVSKALFKLIRDYCETGNNEISINNQQSNEEDEFFRYKKGQFNELYAALNIDITHFKPRSRNSVQSVNTLLSNKQKIKLVYNTCTTLKDIYFLKRFDNDICFCFCPYWWVGACCRRSCRWWGMVGRGR